MRRAIDAPSLANVDSALAVEAISANITMNQFRNPNGPRIKIFIS